MPIFEYVCEKCRNHFEKLQKPGVAEESLCPKCGASEVQKQLSSFSAKGAPSSDACHSSG